MSRRGHVVRSYSTGDIPWRERVGRMGGEGDRRTSRVISSYGSDAAVPDYSDCVISEDRG